MCESPTEDRWEKKLDLRIIAVTVTDGVPLEVGVAVVGGKSVDDVGAVVVDPAAAVGLCKVTCNMGSQ